MSIGNNRYSDVYPTDLEKALNSWRFFDQKIYLKGELGLNKESFAEMSASADQLHVMWAEVSPGSIPNTSVEPWRGKKLVNVKFNDDTYSLNNYMFSLLKNGKTIVDNDPTIYDAPDVTLCVFEDVNSYYWHAPYTRFWQCIIKDSFVQYMYMSNGTFDNTTIQDSKFFSCQFNRKNTEITRWFATNIRDTEFMYCKFESINFYAVHVKNTVFSSCSFDQSEVYPDNTVPYSMHCKFEGCTGEIRSNEYFLNNTLIGCSLYKGNYTGTNKFKSLCENNIFDTCYISGLEVETYFFRNNDFYKSFFVNKPTFDATAMIDGCSFLHTNIDSFYTKQGLLDAVASANNVIWVDGTLLTDTE